MGPSCKQVRFSSPKICCTCLKLCSKFLSRGIFFVASSYIGSTSAIPVPDLKLSISPQCATLWAISARHINIVEADTSRRFCKGQMSTICTSSSAICSLFIRSGVLPAWFCVLGGRQRDADRPFTALSVPVEARVARLAGWPTWDMGCCWSWLLAIRLFLKSNFIFDFRIGNFLL